MADEPPPPQQPPVENIFGTSQVGAGRPGRSRSTTRTTVNSGRSYYPKDKEPTFMFPVNDLEVTVSPRGRPFRPPPLARGSATPFIATAYDEFTRDWVSLSIGRLAQKIVPCVKYRAEEPPQYPADDHRVPGKQEEFTVGADHPEEQPGSKEVRVLHYYQAYYKGPRSTYRRTPDLKLQLLLLDRPAHFIWMEIAAQGLSFKIGELEPVFCSLTLYRIMSRLGKKGAEVDLSRSGRVSETFWFDMNSGNVRRKFAHVFTRESPTGNPDHIATPPPIILTGSSTRGSAGIGMGGHANRRRGSTQERNVTGCRRALFALDPKNADGRLFLVLQLSKVLQGEPEKVLEAYTRGRNKSNADSAAEEAAQRLWRYRQPLAFGVHQVAPEGRVLGAEDIPMSLYRQNDGLSEEGLMRHAIEAVTASESRVKSSSNITTLDGKFTFSCRPLGSTMENPQLRGQKSLKIGEGDGDILIDSNLCVLPQLTPDVDARRLVREVQALPLISANMSGGSGLNRMYTFHSNVMYVYVQGLERCQQRNLAIRVELRLYPTGLESRASVGDPLPAIFSHQLGPTFVSECYAQTTYHSRNPQMCDEIKVQLPENLTNRHRLVFTVFHVHVKRKTGGMFNKGGSVDEQVEFPIGAGSLPLMRGSALLPDDSHIILLSPNANAVSLGLDDSSKDDGNDFTMLTNSPMSASSATSAGGAMCIRVQTRAVSSLYTQDPNLAAFLVKQPPPLGYVKSMALDPRPDPGMLRAMCSSLDGLEEATDRLQAASEWAIEGHFLVTVRALMRCLCFGKSDVDYSWGDPNEHHRLRCTAFVSLLHTLHKCASYFTKVDVSTKALQPSQSLLLAWVEHLMDEEVPVERGAHDPAEQARQRAREQEELRCREEEVLNRLTSEVLQHAMGSVADWLIDHYTGEAIKDKMVEERNSGRASGSGEFGADLWVEAMVSKGLKWVQSWRAEGQTGNGEQGQAMSPRRRTNENRRSSIFGYPVDEPKPKKAEVDLGRTLRRKSFSSGTRSNTSDPNFIPSHSLGKGASESSTNAAIPNSNINNSNSDNITNSISSSCTNSNSSSSSNSLPGGLNAAAAAAIAASAAVVECSPSSSFSSTPPGSPVHQQRQPQSKPQPQLKPTGSFTGTRVGSMRLGAGTIAGFAVQPGAAKGGLGAGGAAGFAGGGGSSGGRPQSMRTAPPSPLPPVAAAVVGQTGGGGTPVHQHHPGRSLSEPTALISRIMGSGTSRGLGSPVRRGREARTLEERYDGKGMGARRTVAAGNQRSVLQSSLIADGVSVPSVSVPSVRVLSKPRTNMNNIGVGGGSSSSSGGGNSSCNARSSPPTQPQPATAEGCERNGGRGSTRLRTFEEKLNAGDKKWWPWLYEVLVVQWTEVLATARGDGIVDVLGAGGSKRATGAASGYPYTRDTLPQHTTVLSQVYAPVLLAMVLKSLSLRVKHEKLRTPVRLDDAFLEELETLIALLARYISEAKTLGHTELINNSLAVFIRDLFAVVHPAHAARLCGSYIRALRSKEDAPFETQFTLGFLRRLAIYDHVVALNSPRLIPSGVHRKTERDLAVASSALINSGGSTRPYSVPSGGVGVGVGVGSVLSGSALRPRVGSSELDGASPTDSLEPHWLVELVIQACIGATVHEKQAVRMSGLTLLRDLQVFHTYDYRYQDGYSRQRVAAMYLPLIHYMAAKVAKLDAMNPRDPERREMLVTFLYVLQDAPEALLRDMWKDVGIRFFRMFSRKTNAGGSGAGGGGVGTPSPAARRGSASFSSGALSTESLSIVSPYASTPGNRTVFSPFSSHGGGSAAAAAARFGPGGGGGLGGSVGVGGERTSSVKAGALLGLGLGKVAATDRTLAGAHALAPLPQEIRGAAGSGYLFIDEFQVFRILGLLELCIDTFEYPGQVSKQVSKQWTAKEAALQASSVLAPVVESAEAKLPYEEKARARKWVSHQAQSIVRKATLILMDECSTEVLAREEIRPAPKQLVRRVLSSLLHALSVRQSDVCLVRLFEGAIDFLRRYGARVFVSSVGNRLQDWLRRSLIHCNAQRYRLRTAGRNFLTYLLRSAFHYYGSIGVVRKPLMAVFQGMISCMSGELDKGERHRGSTGTRVSTVQEAVQALAPLDTTLEEMRDKLPSSDPSFRYRMKTFMDELLLVKRAYLIKLRYLKKVPASSDGSTGMGLDGYASKYWLGLGVTDLDSESVQEVFMQAASVFNSTELPKERADWLFTLAEYHKMLNNDAEQGRCLIEIYQGFKRCLPIWDQLWKMTPFSTSSDKSNRLPSTGYLRAQIDEEAHPVCLRPWNSEKELKRDIIGHANQAGARLGEAALPLLANEAYRETLTVARFERDYKIMAQAHNEIHQFMKKAMQQETAGLGGIGAFFRVGFWGALPAELKGLEFVYRVPLMTHVSDFQNRVLQLIYPLVPDPAKVKALPDSVDETLVEDDTLAYIKITSVKPVVEVFDAGEGAIKFVFHTPFTIGGRVHGSTSEQCKKLTELEVPLPFPCCTSRQIVYRRVVTLLSPIECSIDDIGSQIIKMREEVQAGIDRASDTKGLTMLVQGSVLPQVNGGAVEVAETFLKALPDDEDTDNATTSSAEVTGQQSGETPAIRTPGASKKGKRFAPIALITEERAAELRGVLREMLIEFLELCRQLVLKTRTVLNVPRNVPMVVPRAVGEERTAEELSAEHNILWQNEMERGFFKMMKAMEVYLKDGDGWEDLKANTKNYAP